MRLCQAWALYSPLVTADAVELAQFPELSERFAVRAVPTVILRAGGATATLAGALPEELLLAALLKAAGPELP